MGLRIEPGSHSWHSAVHALAIRRARFAVPSHRISMPKPRRRPTRAAGRDRSQPSTATASARSSKPSSSSSSSFCCSNRSPPRRSSFPPARWRRRSWAIRKKSPVPTAASSSPSIAVRKSIPAKAAGRLRSTPASAPIAASRSISPAAHRETTWPTIPKSRGIADPGWNSGDRVLVAKFVYDLLNKIPDRLDVVVFKYPGDSNFPSTGPHRNHVPMNYIKRSSACRAKPSPFAAAICIPSVPTRDRTTTTTPRPSTIRR